MFKRHLKCHRKFTRLINSAVSPPDLPHIFFSLNQAHTSILNHPHRNERCRRRIEKYELSIFTCGYRSNRNSLVKTFKILYKIIRVIVVPERQRRSTLTAFAPDAVFHVRARSSARRLDRERPVHYPFGKTKLAIVRFKAMRDEAINLFVCSRCQ